MQRFDGFNLIRMAAYGPDDLERILENRRIGRNRRKIIGTVKNARTMLEFIDDHGSFHAYLRTLDNLDHYARLKVLTRSFVGLGRTSALVFLRSHSGETPAWQDR